VTLNFPNASRSYDAKNGFVCFWGYDNVMEISFFLELDALDVPGLPSTPGETEYLKTFDAALERIHDVARKIYGRTGKSACVLTAGDF
jgi:hypothetical protein